MWGPYLSLLDDIHWKCSHLLNHKTLSCIVFSCFAFCQFCRQTLWRNGSDDLVLPQETSAMRKQSLGPWGLFRCFIKRLWWKHFLRSGFFFSSFFACFYIFLPTPISSYVPFYWFSGAFRSNWSSRTHESSVFFWTFHCKLVGSQVGHAWSESPIWRGEPGLNLKLGAWWECRERDISFKIFLFCCHKQGPIHESTF